MTVTSFKFFILWQKFFKKLLSDSWKFCGILSP